MPLAIPRTAIRLRQVSLFAAVLAATLCASPALAQFTQQGSKLVGTGAVGNAQQGESVALSFDGNTALVGADEDSGGTGAVWVWTRTNGAWGQQGSKLVGTGASGNARQGKSVALSADGNTAVIGGPSDGANFTGAVWVWTRSGGVWTQQGPKLAGTGAAAPGNAGQGQSVSLSADGNTLLVGGWTDNGLTGAAWVWIRQNGVWSQQGPKLVGSGAVGIQGRQGFSVSLSADGNTAIVGGYNDNSQTGAAWVWTRAAGVWTQQGSKLVGTGAVGGAQQGYSVAISSNGNTALVGGIVDNAGAGAAWVWTRTAGVWTQQGSKLVGAGAVGGARQGLSVSLSADGNSALIGGENDNAGFPGASWLWRRSGSTWSQQGAKLVGSGPIGPDSQGEAVALSGSGHTAIVGGYFENSQIGAAWIFAAPTAAGVNLVQNGDFSAAGTYWLQFGLPDASGMISQVTNGVFEFQRVGTQAVVFQQTGLPLPSGAPVNATFTLGNTDAVRKRISVLVHDADFLDLHVCTFWLPANAPLSTYSVRTHTTQAWANLTISFYAATAGIGGFYQLDDVNVQYVPAQSATSTECVDPTVPAPPGGSPGPTLLVNGDFGSGAVAPGWTTFGQIQSQVTGNVFEFLKLAGSPAGVVLQPTGQTIAANEILTAMFQLGNSSAVRKRVTILLHDLNFTDLSACTFWIAPGQALSTYTYRTFATQAWTNATVSVYPATAGTEQWIRLDNVSLARTPSAVAIGTECLEPTDGSDEGSAVGEWMARSHEPFGRLRSAAVIEYKAEALSAASAVQPQIATGFRDAIDAWVGDGFERSGDMTPGESRPTWVAALSDVSPRTLTRSAPLSLTTGQTILTFQSWLSASDGRARVQVSADNLHWETVYVAAASDTWVPMEIDLSRYAGHSLWLRFAVEESGTGSWRLGGVRWR